MALLCLCLVSPSYRAPYARLLALRYGCDPMMRQRPVKACLRPVALPALACCVVAALWLSSAGLTLFGEVLSRPAQTGRKSGPLATKKGTMTIHAPNLHHSCNSVKAYQSRLRAFCFNMAYDLAPNTHVGFAADQIDTDEGDTPAAIAVSFFVMPLAAHLR